ncbi:MAG: hypothetical protein HFJ91_10100 [Muribaculaceae bacterium]|nr:hypothetical protein [Muribaculaceae bacterium]
MRKTLLTIAAMAMTLTMSAAAPEGLITSQPEGTLYPEVYTSAREFLVYNNMPGRTNNSGYNTPVVINGNDIYLHNVVRDYDGLDSWIHGTITDGVAEFPLPQPVQYIPGTAGDGSDDVVVYVEMFKAVRGDGAKDIVADTENPSLRMSWDGKKLTQILPGSSTDDLDYDGLCGLANVDHTYMSYGSQNIRMTIWDSDPITPPAGLETSKYTLSYVNSWGSIFGYRVNVGVSGNEMWIQGLNSYIPDAWIHGTSSPMLINLGNEIVSGGDGMDIHNATLTPFVELPMTPADPIIIDLSYEEGISMLLFTILNYDTEGVPLDTDRLFFNVFVNGEKYTFTPEKEFVTEPITDIPFTYSNDDSFLMNGGDGLFIAAIEGEVRSMGVQSFYLNGANKDDIRRSEIVSEGESAINEVSAESPVVDTRYYNLNGVEVHNPGNGLFIKKITRANGKVETTKAIIR